MRKTSRSWRSIQYGKITNTYCILQSMRGLVRRYDLIMMHSLEWPSLTVEWLPTVEE